MQAICQRAESFLTDILGGLELSISASAKESADGCLVNFSGDDVAYLRAEGGELLEALEHLINQVFSREIAKGQRIVCDVEGFRSVREAELRAMAQHAANHVRTTGTSFTFGPMDANERRIIHLALAEDEFLQTESIGDGHARRLKVIPKAV